MDRLEAMRTFVKVVESGSITAAAGRLGIAKSAVSRRPADLEGRLSAQFLRRTTRTLSVTETGQDFYERCRRILADVEEAELAGSQQHGTLRGRLRVAAPLSFGLGHLGPAMDAFLGAHPGIEFDLDLNDRQVDLLLEGFDLAVRIAKLQDSGLVARRLAPVHQLVCASPDYLARRGTPGTAAELADHDCLVYTNMQTPGAWDYRDPAGQPGRVQIQPRILANNGDYLRRAAEDGHGCMLGPSFILYQSLEQGRLIAILRDHAWPTLHAYALYPHTRYLSQRVRAFVDFLAERFSGVPYWDRGLAVPEGPTQ